MHDTPPLAKVLRSGRLHPTVWRPGARALAGQLACVWVLLKRTALPQFSRAVVMHQWHRGRPPLPYLWVLRWQPEQGPTRLPEQVKVDGPAH